MYTKVTIIFYITMYTRPTWTEMRDFKICHEEFNLKPPDGLLKELTFPWLGFVQYVHMTSRQLHHYKAPRVVLIHNEFVIGTAMDLMHQPKGYELGHVVFSEYERNEDDCGLSRRDILSGIKCPRASIEVSIRNVLPHPEFSRFAVGNSIVLVKLYRSMISYYMLPICLPSRSERMKKKSNRVVYMIDYMSSVPKDFDSEKMAKKTLKLYTHRECKRHRKKADLGNEGVTHVLCSTGCGVRPGAPIISQSTEGRFELVGLAAGGAPCSHKSMRKRLNPEPPLYIDLYPYTSWIISIITAHRIPKPYPENFVLKEGSHIGLKRSSRLRSTSTKRGWKGRIYMVGDICFDSLNAQKQQSSFFYVEQFHVEAKSSSRLRVEIMVNAGEECEIDCARIVMPNRAIKPKVSGVGHSNITVNIDAQWFPNVFIFQMGLTGTTKTLYRQGINHNIYNNRKDEDYEEDYQSKYPSNNDETRRFNIKF